MSFAYAPEWLDDATRLAISISLPKRAQRFSTRACRPFFAGLLPEEAQLDAVARALGVSKGNDFGLLEALGGDVAGALTLWPKDQAPPALVPENIAKPLDDDALVQCLMRLPSKPLLAGEGELRLSLAGAQAKLPIVLVEGKVALPVAGQPTTHILKPPIPGFTAMTENEALVMTLAAAVGLSVAAVEPRTVQGRPYLLITRYDRQSGEDGLVRRLHQEDFCQALGLAPEKKYAAEGGPTFKMGFNLLRRASMRPAVEVLKFLDAAIFNLIVGNSDAHGKNFSLLYENASISLAPLYDLVCTVAYPDLTPRMAMKIGNRGTLDEIRTTTWRSFAADAGLGVPFVLKRVRELSQAVQSEIENVSSRLAALVADNVELARIATLINARAERVAKTGNIG